MTKVIQSEDDRTYVRIDPVGALLVDGIEDWIVKLVPIGPATDEGLLRLKDVTTGAIFMVKRIE